MLWTAIPSTVAALTVYTLAGSGGAGDGLPESARTLLSELDRVYVLNPVVLLPALIVVWSIVRRTPPALALAISSVVAAALGVAVQGFGVSQAVSAVVHQGLKPDAAFDLYNTLKSEGK